MPSRPIPVRSHKPNRRYVAYRVYFVLSLGGYLGFLAAFAADPPVGLWLLVLIPLFAPGAAIAFHLMAFRYPSSVIGPFLRTPLPSGEPILRVRASGGQIGFFPVPYPLVTWYVFREGLGFEIVFFGRGFVPVRDIVRVYHSRYPGAGRALRFVYGGFGRGLLHRSEEIRRYLGPPKRVFNAVERLVSTSE